MFQQDYPMIDIESESDQSESSDDDEINIILHGTPEQKRKLVKHTLGQESSSEDEYEKEMRLELDNIMKVTMKEAGVNFQKQNFKENSSTSQRQSKDSGSKFELDDDDSEDDDETSANTLRNHLKNIAKGTCASSDDPFYDPELDNDDQMWVDNQRRKYQPKASSEIKPLPQSDAVLNCPGCMSLLCLDCQRHDVYKNQYRAMFVSNCSVIHSESLQQPKLKQTRRKRKPKTAYDESETDNINETYHPVRCSVCNTEVAVFDSEEVFHFFNVLASHG